MVLAGDKLDLLTIWPARAEASGVSQAAEPSVKDLGVASLEVSSHPDEVSDGSTGQDDDEV